MKKITLEYCGMPGSGATVREAKADAARSIQTLLSEITSPRFIRWRETCVIIFRDRADWGYMIRRMDEAESDVGHFGGSCHGFASLDACDRAARLHLADMVRREGEGVPEIISKAPMSAREVASMEREYMERARRDDAAMVRARAADAAGLTDPNLRHIYITDGQFMPQYAQILAQYPSLAV
jgi:hypothetical protein